MKWGRNRKRFWNGTFTRKSFGHHLRTGGNWQKRVGNYFRGKKSQSTFKKRFNSSRYGKWRAKFA